jgi:hypothetical protein
MFSREERTLINKFKQMSNIDKAMTALLTTLENRLQEVANTEKRIKGIQTALENIVAEKTKGFPWLADVIGQYFELYDDKLATYLRNKKRPAFSAAEQVKQIAKEKRILKKEFIVARNLLKYYESLFPWLKDYVGEDIDELVKSIEIEKTKEEETDPVSFYVTPSEYKNLSSVERNQKALDRYWSRTKSNWELGRDYERYIGFLYEKEGFTVSYKGIVDRFEDLGRDLIVTKGSKAFIIQCKYWAQHKRIHENHITQLLGTTLKYWIEKNRDRSHKSFDFFSSALTKSEIKGILITSTTLSETAKEFARELGIEFKESLPLSSYPSIKCNIARVSKEKIYHLPFDQQYDNVVIEKDKKECYVTTTKEAEELGFRRAFRWKGNN